MSTTVDNAFVETYMNNVRHLAQQGNTRLRQFVMVENRQSEGHNWDRIAAAAATQKTTRKQATPDNNTAWSRRKSIPVVYNVGDSTEQEDITQMLVDPNSNYARAHGMAMRRAMDDEIIAAAIGQAARQKM